MLRKKLSVIGKSRGVILDKSLLDLYHFQDEVLIRPTPDGKGMEIRPVQSPEDERMEKVKAAMERGNARYGRMLKNLA